METEFGHLKLEKLFGVSPLQEGSYGALMLCRRLLYASTDVQRRQKSLPGGRNLAQHDPNMAPTDLPLGGVWKGSVLFRLLAAFGAQDAQGRPKTPQNLDF